MTWSDVFTDFLWLSLVGVIAVLAAHPVVTLLTIVGVSFNFGRMLQANWWSK